MPTTTHYTGFYYGEGSDTDFSTQHFHFGGNGNQVALPECMYDGHPVTHVGYSLTFRNTDLQNRVPEPDLRVVTKVVGEVQERLRRAGVELLKPPVQSTTPAIKFRDNGQRTDPVFGESITRITFRLPKQAHDVVRTIVKEFKPFDFAPA